jgi:polysaccharide pyruvyl transferase WcaK-like protein
MGPVLNGAGAAPAFFDLYRGADMVIGMRGHSVICAVGASTPVLGLGSHDKVSGFLAEVGLGDWAVDLTDDPRLARLGRGVRAILDDLPASSCRIHEALPGLREQTRRFHREIARRLGA